MHLGRAGLEHLERRLRGDERARGEDVGDADARSPRSTSTPGMLRKLLTSAFSSGPTTIVVGPLASHLASAAAAVFVDGSE